MDLVIEILVFFFGGFWKNMFRFRRNGLGVFAVRFFRGSADKGFGWIFFRVIFDYVFKKEGRGSL